MKWFCWMEIQLGKENTSGVGEVPHPVDTWVGLNPLASS